MSPAPKAKSRDRQGGSLLKFIGGLVVFFGLVALAALYLLGSAAPSVQDMTARTAEAVNLYASNLMHNDRMAEEAGDLSYEEFQVYIETRQAEWQELDRLSAELEEIAAAVEAEQAKVAWVLVPPAHAYYDKSDVSRIYDNAPKGKGIRTLAKELNVSAKKAFQILKMSQNELKAEAWNNAGDRFETLENGARAVKNASKVGLYVVGNAVTGGAVGAVGTLAQAGAIISNVDLVLEITQDTAAAYYGYNSDVVAVFSDIRLITEPGASLIGLSNLSIDSAKKAIETVVFTAEQLSGTIQEGKVLGIEVKRPSLKAELGVIPKDKVGDWLKEKGLSDQPDSAPAERIIAQGAEKVLADLKPVAPVEAPPAPVAPAVSDSPADPKPDEPVAPSVADNIVEGLGFIGTPKSLNGTVWRSQLDDPNYDYIELTFGDGTVKSQLYKNGAKTGGATPGAYTYDNGRGVFQNAGDVGLEVRGDSLFLTRTWNGETVVSEYKRVK